MGKYEDAVGIFAERRTIKVSIIQRSLGIGYTDASDILDRMLDVLQNTCPQPSNDGVRDAAVEVLGRWDSDEDMTEALHRLDRALNESGYLENGHVKKGDGEPAKEVKK